MDLRVRGLNGPGGGSPISVTLNLALFDS